MSAVTPQQAITDALALLKCAATPGENPLACIASAVPLLEDALLALPPIDASALTPTDRAAAYVAAQALEDAKFPPK